MVLLYDLAGFLLTQTLVATRGASKLTASGSRRAVPLELDLRVRPDAELTPRQAEFFREHDRRLQTLGYTPICTHWASNLFGGGAVRSYFHGVDGSNCRVVLVEYAAIVQGQRHVTQATSLHFVSTFPDGGRLITDNSEQMGLFELLPKSIRQRRPDITDASKLKEVHERRMKSLPTPLAAVTNVESLLPSNVSTTTTTCNTRSTPACTP